jgi:TetR/AcrR family transcriptional regulator
MPGPRTRLRAEERREVIIDAAREEFTRTGYAGTKVRAIAVRAGVNDAMLYRHFESKEDLFEAAVAEPISTTVRNIIERPWPAEPQGTGTAVMRERTVTFFEDLLRAMSEIAPLLGVVLFADQDRGRHFYREHIEAAFAGIAALTRATIGDWMHKDFDEELFARIVIGLGFMMAVDAHLGSHGSRDTRTLAVELTTILFDGIAVG